MLVNNPLTEMNLFDRSFWVFKLKIVENPNKSCTDLPVQNK